MSAAVVKPLASGILHLPADPSGSGYVGIVSDTGLAFMRGVPEWDEAILVAVLQVHRAATRRHWFARGRRTVYTRTVETPIVLGTGAIRLATTDLSGLPDLLGVAPGGSDQPHLNRLALARVHHQLVRLELHRPHQSRSAPPHRGRSTQERTR